ncbi:hypothetical protein GGX14DRAFT_575795 [Mycena pura]|uniref:Uncharacterized protein n=1 Tax=Mycena pura TaxID=153505 RepID=A0AAD6UYN6_9AGAR|nr:hypothetical protein GGX14DRAFT_575795 [Mycena pura]
MQSVVVVWLTSPQLQLRTPIVSKSLKPITLTVSPEERGRLGMQELLQQLDASVPPPPDPIILLR